MQNQAKVQDTRNKADREKIQNEKDDLQRQLQRIISKETQYKHELRNKDVQISKLSETIKQRMFDAKTQGGQGPKCELFAPTQANPQFKFSKISGESDFHLMVSQDQEKLFQQMSTENGQLKDALKMLQRELLDIV